MGGSSIKRIFESVILSITYHYLNMVSNLIQKAIRSTAEFDPFMLKFTGANTTEYNKFVYQALLEVTSYFWDQSEVVELYWKRLLLLLVAPIQKIILAKNQTSYRIVKNLETQLRLFIEGTLSRKSN